MGEERKAGRMYTATRQTTVERRCAAWRDRVRRDCTSGDGVALLVERDRRVTDEMTDDEKLLIGAVRVSGDDDDDAKHVKM